METYLLEFSHLFAMNFLNMVSPGPETALMVHNSTYYSRSIGFYTGLGIVCSTFIHKSYSILGFGKFVAENPSLFNTLKYAGTLYLFYLAIKMLLGDKKLTEENNKYITHLKRITRQKAFRMGFTIDLLHPQASLAFITILASTISQDTPLYIQAIYGILLVLTSLTWYSFLAFTTSHKSVKKLIRKGGAWVTRSMGIFMLYFAYKLITRSIE